MTTSIYTISVYYDGEFVALPICDLSKLKFVRTREGLARVREKIDGKISVYRASFDLIADLKLSYGEVDYQIYKNNVLYFGGKLILNAGTFDYTKKFAELTVNYEDTYIDFLSGYDVESNMLLSSENISLTDTSIPIEFCFKYDNSFVFNGFQIIDYTPPDWNSGTSYISEFYNLSESNTGQGVPVASVGSVVRYNAGSGYKSYFCTANNTNQQPNLHPTLWIQLADSGSGEGRIKKMYGQKLSYKYDNTFYPYQFNPNYLEYVKEGNVATVFTITYKGGLLEGILNLFTSTDTNYIQWYYSNDYDIYILDKSDAKRPNVSGKATMNMVSLKTILENLLNLFQIDWYIENGYLYLIDYYSFSLDTYELDLSNYSKVTTYSIEGEKPMKEIWSQEQSDANFARFEIKYNNYGENVKEYTCADVNNNMGFLLNNPSTASDSGRTFSICEKKTLSVPAKIPIANGIVNYLCSANELKDTLLQYRRPWEKDINGNVFESVAPDKQVAEIITENMDIFSINFLKFVKISLSENCEIQSVTEEFKNGKMIFSLKF